MVLQLSEQDAKINKSKLKDLKNSSGEQPKIINLSLLDQASESSGEEAKSPPNLEKDSVGRLIDKKINHEAV